MCRYIFAILLVVLCVTAAPLRALDSSPDKVENIEFFEKKIRPLLVDHCYKCHSAQSEKLKGGLRLDSRAAILKGGKTGPAAVPGDIEKSLIVKAVRYTDEDTQMPPKEKLSTEQIKAIEEWIGMGMPDPRTEIMALGPPPPAIDFEKARQFWSFQPPREPAFPMVKNTAWVRSPIDQFILGKLEEKGLAPAADADKRTLIRRATYDLTGLPPKPDDVEAFVNDLSPSAYENLVDRLLASPEYGEQWGRHWLDIVRYGDTSGCNSDFPIPQAYRYRNYVINSFNHDKQYDQFLREQIAGDLMNADPASDNYEKLIATGFLALARRFGSGASEFHLTIEDTIDTVGKSMLGLSLGCARCHDHKFDPISNSDYYALYGIFESTRYAFPGTETFPHPKDLIPLAPPAKAEEIVKVDVEIGALDTKLKKLREERDKLERAEKADKDAEAAAKDIEKDDKPRTDSLKLDDFDPSRRTMNQIHLAFVKAAMEDARNRQKQLEQKFANVEKAYAVRDGTPADAKIQRKGDPANLGDEVPRRFLTILGGQALPKDEKGSGRLELARWLTDPRNPLTARVMVNRIWQYHFGKGLVQSPNDFGARGRAPTHPELLDYLALRFIDSGWSIKAMHRRIMLSHAYQMASAHNPKYAETDPDNQWLWKFNRRRLSAEEIRDTILSVSGTLDKSMGEAHPFPPQIEWHYTQHTPFIAVYESNRRSIYLMQQRIKKHPYLEVFDGADTNVTSPDRPLSTTALQALYLMNDPFMHDQSDRLAVRVGMAFSDEAERVAYAYRLAYNRAPTDEEMKECRKYLQDCRAAMKATKIPSDQQFRATLASYMRVLLSSNEFLFVD